MPRKVGHTIKRTAFESFGNPAILEDEGWRSFFHSFGRLGGGWGFVGYVFSIIDP
jgi:hypothetical protein